jgi:hypothetical protein
VDSQYTWSSVRCGRKQGLSLAVRWLRGRRCDALHQPLMMRRPAAHAPCRIVRACLLLDNMHSSWPVQHSRPATARCTTACAKHIFQAERYFAISRRYHLVQQDMSVRRQSPRQLVQSARFWTHAPRTHPRWHLTSSGVQGACYARPFKAPG